VKSFQKALIGWKRATFVLIMYTGYMLFSDIKQTRTAYSKSELELESKTSAKFCQLIARLSIILPQLVLTNLNLEYLKLGFKCKKE